MAASSLRNTQNLEPLSPLAFSKLRCWRLVPQGNATRKSQQHLRNLPGRRPIERRRLKISRRALHAVGKGDFAVVGAVRSAPLWGTAASRTLRKPYVTPPAAYWFPQIPCILAAWTPSPDRSSASLSITPKTVTAWSVCARPREMCPASTARGW